MARYALVGTGSRAFMYIDAVCGPFADTNELVGLCDTSVTRAEFHRDRIARKYDRDAMPIYSADRFDDMIRETKPDEVIVTTVDAFHDEYIVRAMELGCDVVTEKPMTTTLEKAHRILDAVERTGRRLRMAFNYRYAPAYTALRAAVERGDIGTPMLVDFHWMLDTMHGADYFRRWHREKQFSGGLLVHKATHHFDLANWWAGSTPATVFAMGDLRFYGDTNAKARGEERTYPRYTGEAEAAGDPFAFDLNVSRTMRGLYLEAEEESGYLRDQNVMGPGITIEDTMAVTARFRSGALLSYSLVAYSPWEGLRVAITGDRGRIELDERHGASHGVESPEAQRLTLHPMFGAPEKVEIPAAVGDHGGGDYLMLEQLFAPNPPADPYGRAATHIDGAASILLGLSANESTRTGTVIDCASLLAL